jgi:sedoheptulose-bisphosphatase
LIDQIHTRFHKQALESKDKATIPSDVLCVAHGHILRAFAIRWTKKDLPNGPTLLLEAGGVGTLSYEHHSIDEPAILLGGAFMVDTVENVEAEAKAETGEPHLWSDPKASA